MTSVAPVFRLHPWDIYSGLLYDLVKSAEDKETLPDPNQPSGTGQSDTTPPQQPTNPPTGPQEVAPPPAGAAPLKTKQETQPPAPPQMPPEKVEPAIPESVFTATEVSEPYRQKVLKEVAKIPSVLPTNPEHANQYVDNLLSFAETYNKVDEQGMSHLRRDLLELWKLKRNPQLIEANREKYQELTRRLLQYGLASYATLGFTQKDPNEIYSRATRLYSILTTNDPQGVIDWQDFEYLYPNLRHLFARDAKPEEITSQKEVIRDYLTINEWLKDKRVQPWQKVAFLMGIPLSLAGVITAVLGKNNPVPGLIMTLFGAGLSAGTYFATRGHPVEVTAHRAPKPTEAISPQELFSHGKGIGVSGTDVIFTQQTGTEQPIEQTEQQGVTPPTAQVPPQVQPQIPPQQEEQLQGTPPPTAPRPPQLTSLAENRRVALLSKLRGITSPVLAANAKSVIAKASALNGLVEAMGDRAGPHRDRIEAITRNILQTDLNSTNLAALNKQLDEVISHIRSDSRLNTAFNDAVMDTNLSIITGPGNKDIKGLVEFYRWVIRPSIPELQESVLYDLVTSPSGIYRHNAKTLVDNLISEYPFRKAIAQKFIEHTKVFRYHEIKDGAQRVADILLAPQSNISPQNRAAILNAVIMSDRPEVVRELSALVPASRLPNSADPEYVLHRLADALRPAGEKRVFRFDSIVNNIAEEAPHSRTVQDALLDIVASYSGNSALRENKNAREQLRYLLLDDPKAFTTYALYIGTPENDATTRYRNMLEWGFGLGYSPAQATLEQRGLVHLTPNLPAAASKRISDAISKYRVRETGTKQEPSPPMEIGGPGFILY